MRDLTQTQLQIAHQLFDREADVLELGSQHEQIPDLDAYFELTVLSLQSNSQEKFFYLIQEFIDGKTLEEELHEKGQFTVAEVVAVLASNPPGTAIRSRTRLDPPRYQTF